MGGERSYQAHGDYGLTAVTAQDFAFESNEQRMRAAAHLMASSLAGAYAMNQCREPMRGSLLSQLHALLKPSLDPGVSHPSYPSCAASARAWPASCVVDPTQETKKAHQGFSCFLDTGLEGLLQGQGFARFSLSNA